MMPSTFLRVQATILVAFACFGGGNAGAAAAIDGGQTVSLIFAGDVVLAGQPGKEIAQGHDPFKPFAAILKDADIRVANLECVVATVGEP